MTRFLLAGLILSAILLGLLPAGRGLWAGTAIRMDLDQLVEASDLVLEARVLSSQPVLGKDGLVYTDFQLSVDRTFWGEDLPSRTVRLPGGMLPSGRGTMIPGMATLHPGEDAILMLSSASRDGTRVISGLSQGLYRVITPLSGSKIVTRQGHSEALLDPSTGVILPSVESQAVGYADMIAKCTAAAAGKRARRGASPRTDR